MGNKIIQYKRCEVIDSIPSVRKLVEEKMDGIWIEIFNSNGTVQVLSRSGKNKKSIEEKLGSLNKVLPEGVTLTGEAEYGSQAGSIASTDRGYPVIWLFDFLQRNGGDNILQRKQKLQEFLSSIPNDGFYKLLPLEYKLVSELETNEVWNIYNDFVSKGKEGVVVKYPLNVSYDEEVWLKKKKEVTMDYVIIGFEYSKSDYHAITAWPNGMKPDNLISAIVGGIWIDGKLEKRCRVGALTLEMRVDISLHPEKYLGRVFEGKGFEIFVGGSLRHPSFSRWRPDKLGTECIWKGK